MIAILAMLISIAPTPHCHFILKRVIAARNYAELKVAAEEIAPHLSNDRDYSTLPVWNKVLDKINSMKMTEDQQMVLFRALKLLR